MRYAWRLLATCTILLTGCSVTSISTRQPITVARPATNTTPLEGQVYGGQQPINLSHVYLFALSNSGYRQASTSLLLNTTGTTGDTAVDSQGRYYVTTNARGGFKMQVGDYSCGTNGPQQVYLYSVGGNSGFGSNSAIGLMAVLGQCVNSAFTGLHSRVQINEVTTIVTAWALAGYATDATDMSGSSSTLAATGMANAALSAANLASLATGQPLSTTPAGNGTVPVKEINTLADILAACINSAGPGPGTACDTLFGNALSGGTTGATSTDTATAAINIAHNPGANVATLYGMATPTSPFQPILSASSNGPNDWMMGIIYIGGGGMSNPNGIAIDGFGDVWVPDYASDAVSEWSTTGAPLSPSTGYTGDVPAATYGIAIDGSGNAWVANDAGSVIEFNSSGTLLSGGGYTGGGLINPVGIAIDPNGNAWTANLGGGDGDTGSVSEFSSAGAALSPAANPPSLGGYIGGGVDNAWYIAIDPGGNVWVTNHSTSSISEFSSEGVALSPATTGYTGGGINGPIGIAIDHSWNVWVANYGYGGTSVSKFDSSGTAISLAGGYSGGGLTEPYGIAIDGAGNVWVGNAGGDSVSELTSSGAAISPSTGYTGGVTAGVQDIAVDGSGNVWVTSGGGGADIVEFVGAATPVVTPIVAGVANNTLGTPP
jgi:hypothetical protein